MYIAIYLFEVKKEQEKRFIEAWKNLTKMIYQYEGSLGSRLHHQKGNKYIAYAQWPTKEIYENAGKNMPFESNTVRKAMRESCLKIETIHELTVIDDLLASTTCESQSSN